MTTLLQMKGGIPIVEPPGNILGTAASDLQAELISRVNATDAACVLINFAHVHKIDSSGLGALVSAYIEARRNHGRIGIINVGRNIRNLVVRSRLIYLFEHFEDEDAAVASLSAYTWH
ncbi:STAS domain-containing protein [Candidatus Poribacteria bacterium]|nr:STAS domain-containing protein [Candidatus Poribacteria bacterium]MYA56704.1 STAS domain-containing protein [Candidatus Poribacteria bacterium]